MKSRRSIFINRHLLTSQLLKIKLYRSNSNKKGCLSLKVDSHHVNIWSSTYLNTSNLFRTYEFSLVLL